MIESFQWTNFIEMQWLIFTIRSSEVRIQFVQCEELVYRESNFSQWDQL